MKPILSILALLLFALPSHAAERPPHVWIFSGQSNMQKIGSAAQAAMQELVAARGHEFQSVYSAQPGKPIEAWLDPAHRDHSLWTNIVKKVEEAKEAGGRFQGFVWYQGESNVNERAGRYQEQLAGLVRRVRKLTGEEKLAVIIVQIGSATSYDRRDWAVGAVREAQRRVAAADENVALVTAIDAELGDYAVHLSGAGSEVVAKRVAAAADRLVYGNEKAYWGPQVSRVAFADENRRHVFVTYENVDGRLKVKDGALAGFGASIRTAFPKELGKLEDATALGQLIDDYVFPVAASVVDDHQLLLSFADPLPDNAGLSYAAQRNAQYGPHRRWRLEFGGVTDASGHETPAFALIPLAPATGDTAIATVDVAAPEPAAPWKQIAINCVGRYPPGVNDADAEIGPSADGLRQKYWNPCSAGLTPHLFDATGAVTGVGFESSVWYMSPISREMPTPDYQMMYTWNETTWHAVRGLTPGERYDVIAYVDLPGEQSSKTLVLLATAGEKYRPDGRSLREFEKLAKEAGDFRKIELNEPAGERHHFQGEYIAADEENGFTGNYMVFQDVKAGPDGRIYVTTYAPREWRGQGIRHKQYLNGLQIRRQ